MAFSNLSFVRHVGDGVRTQFPLTVAGENMGYFRTEDIHTYVDGVEVPNVIHTQSPHIVNILPAPSDGADVLIRREMPINKTYADFARGNNFGHRQVNNSFLQQLYLTQELIDGFTPKGFYMKQDVDMGNNKHTNLSDGIDDGDSVNVRQLKVVEDRVGSIEAGLVLDGLDSGDNVKVTPKGTVMAKKLTDLFGESYSKGVRLKELGITERDTTQTDKILQAFIDYPKIIVDGEYWINLIDVPTNAKVQMIDFEQGSVLRLEKDLSLTFNLGGRNLILDMRKGGTIHGGRRGCILSRDHKEGETVLDVVDASDILVGQHLSTSMSFEGTDENKGKWNNAIRRVGDAFNTVTDVDYVNNKVTVTYGVPNCKFPKNTYLQNNMFGRNGLAFKGTGIAYVLGGEVKESASGYYMSALTDIGQDVQPLTVYVDGTDFSGQGLDGFLLRGERVNFVMDNFTVYGTYDNAKQLFVQDTGGDILLRNGYVHRGNYDVEFYPTGQKITLGRIFMQNIIWDGKSTLLVKPDQQWEDGSGTLSDTWSNIGDSLHVTQWASDVKRIETKGLVAIDCEFNNYRRSILGTTFVPTSYDVSITGKLKLINCYMDCAPHHFVAGAGTTIYIQKPIEYQNCYIRAKYSDGYYLIGFIGARDNGNLVRDKILWTGLTRLEITEGTPSSHRIDMDGIFDEFYIKGKYDGTSVTARMYGVPTVNRVIIDNITLNKRDEGQGNQLVDVILTGSHASTSGYPWVSLPPPEWDTATMLLTNNNTGTNYCGMLTRAVFRKASDATAWIPLCGLSPINAENASAQVDLSTAHTYGGSSKVCGSFYVSVPTDGTPITASETPTATNGVITILNNKDVVYPITPIFMENTGAPSDLTAFEFRVERGTLQMRIKSTNDLGVFVMVRGNVVGLT